MGEIEVSVGRNIFGSIQMFRPSKISILPLSDRQPKSLTCNESL